jgi:hypothetical protein
MVDRKEKLTKTMKKGYQTAELSSGIQWGCHGTSSKKLKIVLSTSIVIILCVCQVKLN